MSEDKLVKNITICSFCGKTEHEVERIIVGPAVNICNECVKLCSELTSDYREGKPIK